MEQSLGEFLRSARQAAGFTLRKVEELSEGKVKNGYLSQVESGQIRIPSTHVLNELAKVYKVDYDLVLRRAGLPTQTVGSAVSPRIGAIPMTALEDLDEAETKELLDFVAFIKSKRPS